MGNLRNLISSRKERHGRKKSSYFFKNFYFRLFSPIIGPIFHLHGIFEAIILKYTLIKNCGFKNDTEIVKILSKLLHIMILLSNNNDKSLKLCDPGNQASKN